jgi:hypothetical protein
MATKKVVLDRNQFVELVKKILCQFTEWTNAGLSDATAAEQVVELAKRAFDGKRRNKKCGRTRFMLQYGWNQGVKSRTPVNSGSSSQ